MNNDELIATQDIKEYYKLLTDNINLVIKIANNAKKSGKDISNKIESVPASGIADKVELLMGIKGISKTYKKLWEKYRDRDKLMVDIFDKIISKELGNIEDPEERIDKAIRTALVIQTEGVVVSPLDGLADIKINKNFDGSKYIDIYYAGPISAAGRSAKTLPLILGDRARKQLHLDKYKPNKQEVNRYVEEIMMIQEYSKTSAQTKVTENEIRTIVENCPICVNGGPDSDMEVIVNRNLERVKTNRLRGAMFKVIVEGILINAQSNLEKAKSLGLNWSWLEKLIKVKKTAEGIFKLKENKKYLEGLAAGRPVFGYPLRPGGFRLRYGKGRNTGIMAKAINPATMYILNEFTAVGTHARVERPGKALQFFPCTTIDGPIVRLKNKDVIKIDNVKDAKKYKDDIEKILFLGDLLVSVGDFRKSKHPLIKNGYVEEEWLAEIKYLIKNEKLDKKILEKATKLYNNPTPEEAILLSINYNIPLFPKYLFYYDLLTEDELITLIKKARNSEKIFSEQKIIGVKIKNDNIIKKILEKIGIPHRYKEDEDKIYIGENEAYIFLKTLGALNAKDPLEEYNNLEDLKKETITEKLTIISKIQIKEKSGTYIGARMGRPEAAHPRCMAGKPNVLFPLGHGFGNSRDLIKASKKRNQKKSITYGTSEIEIKSYQCPVCKRILFQNYCSKCKTKTKEIRYCPKCKKEMFAEICPTCKEKTLLKFKHKINIDRLISEACENLKVAAPESLNGVKGLISEDKVAEPLEKGILRAKHGVYVFRDGTSRYEALNATITQFCARELNLTVKELKKLGYKKDYLGNELKNEDQLVSIFPQDVIVDDNCGEYFLKVSKFIDELLVKFYGVEKYYNANKKEDLIGRLIVALAPHTSSGIVARIIGFSKARLAWGHPFFITAKRRNVDGDQDSMMLLMDDLLNFSQSYLSKRRGGRMDAPLSITTILNPYEIDDESLKMETCREYPYEFYLSAKEFGKPKVPEIVFADQMLGTEKQYNCINFTHNTFCFDEGPKKSKYIQIKSMKQKVNEQAELQKKIEAVDEKDALERLLHYHLFPDIIGNTRAFARQKLRCIKCNKKYRRMPLSGKCTCGGKLILTISEGSIKKYVEIAKNLILDYKLKPYLLQKINLAEEEIKSLFIDKDLINQKSLSEFF